ncbi:MAG: NAD(P)-binding domain-containing protein [Methanobacterium sp. ERen5]|nr:MAG: NAD(P)-binding domain-containing protein [Methanobacterium sp. ERen5]
MKKIGFIGYGSMGRVILNGFLDSGMLKPFHVTVSTRTRSKLSELEKNYPEVEIANDNNQTAQNSDVIFLFTGTSDVKHVIEEIKTYLSKKTHIIYISAALGMDMVGMIFDGKITKVIPSITSEVQEGVSLICHQESVTTEESEFVDNLFRTVGDVKLVEEADLDVGADITSCSPAFIAKIFHDFSVQASNNSNFSREEAEKMIISTLYGTSKLLYEKGYGIDDLISAVATKGGITEEGVKILDNELPELFSELFKTTIKKHQIIRRELEEQY